MADEIKKDNEFDNGGFNSPEINDGENPESGSDEMSFSDKLVGIFTSPVEIFTSVSKRPGKTADWVLPWAITIAAIIISSIVLTSNPVTKSLIKDKAKAGMEKRINAEVASGKMSRQQADKQLELGQRQLEYIGSPIALVIQGVSVLIFATLFFVIIGLYFYFLSKFFLGAEFDFNQLLTVNALTGYITVIEIFIVLGINVAMGKILSDSSIASLLEMQDKNILTFLLGKIDVFQIWAYTAMALGYAAIAKTADKKKYFILVFASWLGWSFVWFMALSKLPFFSSFAG